MVKVLVVDDDPDVVLMLRVTFEGEGFDVVSAQDGAEAIDQIEAENPDVVVLDVMMPILDGLGVLEHLRDAGIIPPVIMFSGKANSRQMAEALELGAIDYVTKPFDPYDLVGCVDRTMNMTDDERNRFRRERIQTLMS